MGESDSDPLFQEYARLTPKVLLERLEGRVKARLKLLYEIYRHNFADWRGVYLNPQILREAVESYYCDIYRLKLFRQVEWADDHKKAAYTMKWLARMRPIQMHSGAKATEATLMANGLYATLSGMTLLGVREGWKDDAWWIKYTTNMLYLLHYHSPSVEQLSSEMCTLDRCCLLSAKSR